MSAPPRHAAGGSTGTQAILDALRKRWPSIKHLFAICVMDWNGRTLCVTSALGTLQSISIMP